MTEEKTKKTKSKPVEPSGFDLGTFEEMQPVCQTPANDWKEASLGVFKLYHDAELPTYGTEKSACFDLRAYLGDCINKVYGYDSHNSPRHRSVKSNGGFDFSKRHIVIGPGDRMLINTGLVFKIPEDMEMNIFPRSGVSHREGLGLINSVAVIDCDYVKEVFISVVNFSETPITICNGDRIAQAQLSFVNRLPIDELSTIPEPVSSRNGGFGSTGV